MTDDLLNSEDGDLDALVFEFLEHAEEAPGSAVRSLDELCKRRPDLERALRARVDLLMRAGLWRPDGYSTGDAPEQLGDFRLLRRLGAGGMGVVHLAEQLSVGRRVALKLVRSDRLFGGGARARFLREARAIARLDHASIVRVFTIGEHEGVPYLAMEYVPGAPLDALLRRLRDRRVAELRGDDIRAALVEELQAAGEQGEVETLRRAPDAFARGWIEFVVRVARDTALALQHAHERGVMHRDVKPSNLLLGADGRVRLCDFGLAALSNSDALTRTGAQMGSTPYMAPEQVRGDSAAIGPRTDVYALGVTLYELVTLALPFPGETEEGVRSAILAARPTPLRALQPNAPPDVETVCAKAMDLDPERRYASADDFARDLTNVLELRPIEARPPGPAVRLQRWVQRRPASATAAVLGALLLVAGPLGWELNRMRTTEAVRAAYAGERTARQQSERDFRAALAAVGHVLREFGSEDLRDAPRMQSVRLAAIDRAQELFADLERDRGDDPDLLAEGASLRLTRADLLHDMGRPEESVAECARALALLERLAQAAPEWDTRGARASVHSQRGKSLQAQGRWRESLESLERCEELARERCALPDAIGSERWGRLILALANHAESLAQLGELAPALKLLREAIELVEREGFEASDDPDEVWAAGRAYGDLGDLLRGPGDPASALAFLQRRLSAHLRARDLAPSRRYMAFDVVTARTSLAAPLLEAGRGDEAEAQLLAARSEIAELVRDFPQTGRYQYERWRIEQVLGQLYGNTGRPQDALEVLLASAEDAEARAAAAPERDDLSVAAAQALHNVAAANVQLHGPLEQTLDLLARARVRVDAVLGREPSLESALALRQGGCYTRGLALCNADRIELALAAAQAYEAGGNGGAGAHRYSADLWNELVLALRRAEPDQAARAERERDWTGRMFAHLQAAVEAGYDDVAELDSTAALDSFRDSPEFASLRAHFDARGQ